jgi:hypothetical protein
MRRSDLVQNDNRNSSRRTTQIVFGERQHLLRVLDSLEGSTVAPARRNHERRVLEELIHARTKELNEVNSSWDEKVGLVLSAEASPDQLEKLVKQAPKTDFYLPMAPFAKTWRGILTPILPRWPGFPATAASRSGTWWLSIPIRPRSFGASFRTACASSAKTPPQNKVLHS